MVKEMARRGPGIRPKPVASTESGVLSSHAQSLSLEPPWLLHSRFLCTRAKLASIHLPRLAAAVIRLRDVNTSLPPVVLPLLVLVLLPPALPGPTPCRPPIATVPLALPGQSAVALIGCRLGLLLLGGDRQAVC